MGWLNTSIRFDQRAAILVLSRLDLAEHPQLKAVLDLKLSPEQLEQAFRAIIKLARPNLYECSINWIEYKWDVQGWEVGVAHPGLDPVADGACCPRIPMIQTFKDFRTLPAYRLSDHVEPESWHDKPKLL